MHRRSIYISEELKKAIDDDRKKRWNETGILKSFNEIIREKLREVYGLNGKS